MGQTDDNVVLGFEVDSSGLRKGARQARDELGRFVGGGSGGGGGRGGVLGSFTELNSALNVGIKAFRVMAGVVGLVADAFAEVTGAAIEFEQGLAEVSTLIDKSFGASVADLNKLTKELAKTYGTFPQAQTKALYQAISAGATNAAAATDLMNAANKLAIAGVTDVETAIDGLTSVLNAYGLEFGEATEVSDVFFQTVKLGKTTIPELAATLGRIAPTAKSLNIPLSELGAAVAAITAGGLKSSRAITGLNAAFANIKQPTKEAKEEAARLGVSFSSTSLRAKGLKKFLDDITSSSKFTATTFETLFTSVEGGNAILSLTNGNMEKFNAALVAMESRAGATDVAFLKMTRTLGFQVERFKALKETAKITLGEMVTQSEPARIGLKNINAMASKLIDKLGSSDGQKMVEDFFIVMAAGASKSIALVGGLVFTLDAMRKATRTAFKDIREGLEDALFDEKGFQALSARVALGKELTAEESKQLAEWQEFLRGKNQRQRDFYKDETGDFVEQVKNMLVELQSAADSNLEEMIKNRGKLAEVLADPTIATGGKPDKAEGEDEDKEDADAEARLAAEKKRLEALADARRKANQLLEDISFDAAKQQLAGFKLQERQEKDRLATQKDFAKRLVTQAGTALGGFFANLTVSIAKGEADIGAAFAGFAGVLLSMMGDTLIQLGVAGIVAGIFGTVLPIFGFLTGGPAGVAASIALIAAGGILKGAGSLLGATGGGASAGGGAARGGAGGSSGGAGFEDQAPANDFDGFAPFGVFDTEGSERFAGGNQSTTVILTGLVVGDIAELGQVIDKARDESNRLKVGNG